MRSGPHAVITTSKITRILRTAELKAEVQPVLVNAELIGKLSRPRIAVRLFNVWTRIGDPTFGSSLHAECALREWLGGVALESPLTILPHTIEPDTPIPPVREIQDLPNPLRRPDHEKVKMFFGLQAPLLPASRGHVVRKLPTSHARCTRIPDLDSTNWFFP